MHYFTITKKKYRKNSKTKQNQTKLLANISLGYLGTRIKRAKQVMHHAIMSCRSKQSDNSTFLEQYIHLELPLTDEIKAP